MKEWLLTLVFACTTHPNLALVAWFSSQDECTKFAFQYAYRVSPGDFMFVCLPKGRHLDDWFDERAQSLGCAGLKEEEK